MNPSHNGPSAIFLAWENIVFGSRDPAQKFSAANEATWRQLWTEHIEQRVAETPIEDAVLLCSLGWDLAVHRRDWKTATQRAARCAEHPDWALADRNSRHTLMGYVAIGQLQMGQLHSALEGFRELLDLRQPRDPVPLYIVRNHLYLYTYEQPPDERAPPELVALAAEVLRDFKGCVRTAKQLNPESCAFGRLVEALVRSYPRTELSQAQDRKDENLIGRVSAMPLISSRRHEGKRVSRAWMLIPVVLVLAPVLALTPSAIWPDRFVTLTLGQDFAVMGRSAGKADGQSGFSETACWDNGSRPSKTMRWYRFSSKPWSYTILWYRNEPRRPSGLPDCYGLPGH